MDFNDFIKREYKEKEFDSAVGKIKVSKGRNIYNELKKHYENMALSAAGSFMEFYNSYKNCYDIIEKSPVDFQKSIALIINDIKDTLIKLQRYDLDYDSIFEYIADQGCTNHFNERLDAIVEKVAEINNDVELQKEYRQQRKENRSRWVGGTIGGNTITAVSHQMDISAMNFASGAAHSIANAAGNFITEMQAQADLQSLFEDENVKEMLAEGVYLSASSILYAFIGLIGADYDWDIESDEDCEKAQRIINNLKSGSIDGKNIDNICREVFDLDPYNSEFYEFLFSKFGDDGTLGIIADYFGIRDFINIKDEQALEYIKKNQGKSEEDAIKAKELLITYCKKINLEINDDLKCISYINSLIEDFDLKYRTVDGVVCETREGADFSRKELPKITAFMKDIKAPDSEPCLPYEKNLLAKKEEFKKLFSSEVSKKYLEIINNYLTEFDSKFRKTRVFSSVDRHQAARDRALRYAKGLKFSSLSEFEESYNKFKNFIEPNLGITIDEAIEAKQYLEKKKAKLSGLGTFDLNNISNAINDIGETFKGFFGRRK